MPELDADCYTVCEAVTALKENAVFSGFPEMEIKSHEENGVRDYTAIWTEKDGIHRSVIVTSVVETDGRANEYPPVIAVEYSAWVGPRNGPAEKMYHSTVVDIYMESAPEPARSAVKTAFEAVAEIDKGDLWCPANI